LPTLVNDLAPLQAGLRKLIEIATLQLVPKRTVAEFEVLHDPIKFDIKYFYLQPLSDNTNAITAPGD